MSAGVKFGIVALVIVVIVALGWYLEDSPSKTRPDSAFAKTADGKVDYTRNADGSPIRLA